MWKYSLELQTVGEEICLEFWGIVPDSSQEFVLRVEMFGSKKATLKQV